MIMQPSEILKQMFYAAVSEANPINIVSKHLPLNPNIKNIYVIGAGKAAASMAKATEDFYKQHNIKVSGLVVTRYGHSLPCSNIEVVEASHPVPDRAGFEAAKRILEITQKAKEDDLVICLISGGGSSLLIAPKEGVSIEEKQNITKQLLKSGANIHSINCVRKHLSAIKGGQLAAACKAPMLSLIISDVTGDDISVIASGATVADPTSCQDALDVLEKYNIDFSESIRCNLENKMFETPKPNNECFSKVQNIIIASPFASLIAAEKIASQNKIKTLNLGDYIEGEAKDVAKTLAGIAISIKKHNMPIASPCIIVSGGETSVTVSGKGRGGRNSEFLLAFAEAINSYPDVASKIYALACDTDGIDGTENNAGAIFTPETIAKAEKKGVTISNSLKSHDSYGFFEASNDLIVTNPTLTNVNDFRAIYIL